MKPFDDLKCVFTGEITDQDGSYVIEIPEHEVSLGSLDTVEVYRVGLLATKPRTRREPEPHEPPTQPRTGGTPPVSEGDRREVEIVDVGEEGDGVARIDRGYILFVPEADMGHRVTVEVTQVRENFGFAEIIEGPY